MKGHIRKRSEGSWSVIIELPRDYQTGKRRQKWYTIQGTKRDANKYLRDMLNNVDKGIVIKNTRMTFGEWLRQWLNDYVSIETTPRTLESYKFNVERHIIPALGKLPLTQLESKDIQAFYAKELKNGRADGKGGLSARTILYHHKLISKALKQAVNLDLVARNVA